MDDDCTEPRDPASLLPFSKEIEYAPDHQPPAQPYLNDPSRPPVYSQQPNTD